MQTTVAIVGGGLAGLYAGKLLHAARIDFRLLEARERLGGRVLSVDASGAPSEDGFDLGPSWFWPEAQPQVAALVRELGVPAFPQHSDGDVIFHRMSREAPRRYGSTHQEPQSMRIVGGTGALIQALVRNLPGSRVLLHARVQQMTLRSTQVELATEGPDGRGETVSAEQVIAAVPPRLLARISFSPAMDSATEELWRETPTWMAPHAKFLAIYDRPFWRDAGLSGTAQSMVGPLAEIHDATTASGKAALFGFPGISADARASLGSTALTRACLEQLAHLFGPEARNPLATLLKDWAADPLTATAADRSAGGHPSPSAGPWVTGDWQKLLSLAGSETSAIEPGYLAGAVSAAERAVSEVMQRLRA